MKFLVVIKDMPGTKGPAPILAYENGEILPFQTKTKLEGRTGERTEFTVTFVVDGDFIRLDESK